MHDVDGEVVSVGGVPADGDSSHHRVEIRFAPAMSQSSGGRENRVPIPEEEPAIITIIIIALAVIGVLALVGMLRRRA